MHHHHGWIFLAIAMHRRPHVLEYPGEPTDEEMVRYPSVHLTSIHEWDPSVLDYNHPEGDDPSGHVIHNILISLTPILMPMAYIPRGPSIPYHPWLMCFKLPHRQPTHSFRPTNTKSSQHHLTLINIGSSLVG